MSAPAPTRIYTYASCDRCRRATRWLRAQDIAFTEIPIRDQPPTRGELETMLAAEGGQLRRLFNTSGRDYRAAGLSATLPTLSKDAAFALLEGNGNLVKRPFLLAPGGSAVGFDEARWAALFGR